MTGEGSRHDEAEQHAEHRSKLRFLLHSAASLASTSVVTAGLGFVYWAVAARTFPAASVGESSTAVAAMNLIAPLTLLGFGTLLMTELPAMSGGRSALVSTAALVAGSVAGLAAFICAFTLPAGFLGLPDIATPVVAALFAATVATQSVGSLLDQALLSLIGGGMQFRRNVIQSLVKLALLVVFALTLVRLGALAIILSWLVANVVSIAVVVVLLMRRHNVAPGRLLPAPASLRGLHFHAARHHALNMALFVPYFAIPIVANVILGSVKAAYLYSAWSIASFVFFLPMALSTALFASGARDSRTFLMEFRKTLRYSVLACGAAVLGIVVLGKLVLTIFGGPYAVNGYGPLVVMSLGGFGLIVKDHHVALARVAGNVGREAVLVGTLSLVELGGAAVGAVHGGLIGLSVGWLSAVALGLVVYGPLVWQAYHGRISMPARASQESAP